LQELIAMSYLPNLKPIVLGPKSAKHGYVVNM
jgi:hypothetical protein